MLLWAMIFSVTWICLKIEKHTGDVYRGEDFYNYTESFTKDYKEKE